MDEAISYKSDTFPHAGTRSKTRRFRAVKEKKKMGKLLRREKKLGERKRLKWSMYREGK